MTTVYVTAALAEHAPGLSQTLTHELRTHGINVEIVTGTRNIWIRDWAPIGHGKRYVKFTPKANTHRWPSLQVDQDVWGYLTGPCPTSEIILDGGNVVRSPDGKRVIMTNKTFEDNGGDWHAMKDKLSGLLDADLIVIPPEPGDDLGHSDGVVAWIDDQRCFVNDYSAADDPEYDDYQDKLEAILRAAGVDPVPFPWFYPGFKLPSEAEFRERYPLGDEWNPAPGYAINYLHVGDLICYPTFGIDDDTQTMDTLARWFPDHSLAPIDCSGISMEGGLLHCVSWEN
jgi:agmatine deiminase